MHSADVAVVGAGPAGVAAAVTLARAGREVVLIDKATFPRDKCCGDGLTTGALRHLEEQRASGATHLVLPSTALWWLDHYAGFAEHLRECGELLLDDTAHCRVYRLRGAA